MSRSVEFPSNAVEEKVQHFVVVVRADVVLDDVEDPLAVRFNGEVNRIELFIAYLFQQKVHWIVSPYAICVRDRTRRALAQDEILRTPHVWWRVPQFQAFGVKPHVLVPVVRNQASRPLSKCLLVREWLEPRWQRLRGKAMQPVAVKR